MNTFHNIPLYLYKLFQQMIGQGHTYYSLMVLLVLLLFCSSIALLYFIIPIICLLFFPFRKKRIFKTAENPVKEKSVGKKAFSPLFTESNKHRTVVDHSSIICEVDVGAAFLSTFTKPLFVKIKELGGISQLLVSKFDLKILNQQQ